MLNKHLRILDAFAAFRPFLTLSEIARTTDIPLSSVHRLTTELLAEGMLEKMPDRRYRLGIRLWELASRTPGAFGLREIARPFLQSLHHDVRQHVQLGVLSGNDVLFVERLSEQTAVLNTTLIGARMPAHRTASGLVLLANRHDSGEDADIETVAVGGDESFEVLLRRVRAQGYAVTDGLIHPASRGVAVPIPGPRGGAFAAVSVIVPNDERSSAPLVELLQSCAAQIAEAMLVSREGYVDWPARSAGAPVYAGLPLESVRYLQRLPRQPSRGSH